MHILFSFLLIIVSSFLFSQTVINTEKLAPDQDDKFFMYLEPMLDVQSGNTDVFELAITCNFLWKINDRNRLKLMTGIDHLFENKSSLINDEFAQLRYTHLFGKRWLSYNFAQLQKSKNLFLTERTLIGTGMRLKTLINDSSKFRFDIGIGIMNESEVLDENMVIEDGLYENILSTDVLRMANMLIFKYKVSGKITLHNTTYFQPMLSKFEDYRLLNEIDLIISLNEWLKIEFDYVIRHDSYSPSSLKPTDSFYTTGLILNIGG